MTTATLQRRHFEMIARALKLSISHYADNLNGPWTVSDEGRVICEDMADALRATNPNFDHERFLQACGV